MTADSLAIRRNKTIMRYDYNHTMDPDLVFCCACGARLVHRVPEGDSLSRGVCDDCGVIHYRNPRMVVGALAVWEDKVLLCKRAIEPRHGKWTLPAGFMENGETVGAAAVRETLEEACARVELGPMFSHFSVPQINQVHVFYRAQLLDLNFSPGLESLEVALFAEADIPWGEIAFRTVKLTLRHYFADRQTGNYGLHAEDMIWPPAA
jgi:ADP-ribose pyrophosphatase YjhB (NUDIX family)